MTVTATPLSDIRIGDKLVVSRNDGHVSLFPVTDTRYNPTTRRYSIHVPGQIVTERATVTLPIAR